MSKGNKGKDRREQGDSRSIWIMISAAVVLGIVIIAMAVQLVRLNRQGERNKSQIKTEASVDQKKKNTKETEKPAGTKEPEEEKIRVEHIRKDLDPEKPMVALTFDDGPYDRVTNRIVKVLAKHDSRATFFVVGNRVERYADTMKNAYNKGNQIATHTFDHGDLSKMKKKQIRRELKRAFRVMKKINGENPTMLRPPYGNVNDKMRQTIRIPMIYWNVDTEDWASRNKDKILSRCKSIKDGDIVLMHDLYPSTAAAVEKLVPKLRKKGFQLVTVEELFYYKGIDAKGGKVYFNGR
ncbi:polysaccharide deacetylase family protein [Jutongia sp.]|uniref:polysaccharide deacetylase family protein n=1 Tax=Jutongia sp. TaxID=2944204 RepID=UPI000336BB38|nr:polysaccharide deacetylase [Clostridium sp. CAG:277]